MLLSPAIRWLAVAAFGLVVDATPRTKVGPLDTRCVIGVIEKDFCDAAG